jgi:hypothetical protein
MTTATIPPRQRTIQDPEKRFYVQSKKSVKLELEKEAFARGTDLWTLGGAVLEAWLAAGCPDFGFSPDTPRRLRIRPRHRRHRRSRTTGELSHDHCKAAQHPKGLALQWSGLRSQSAKRIGAGVGAGGG